MNIQVGDHVVYVPKQNSGDNVHHGAVVECKTQRGLYRLTLDTGRRVICSMRRLLVGQLDAFEQEK